MREHLRGTTCIVTASSYVGCNTTTAEAGLTEEGLRKRVMHAFLAVSA